jgi:hypothetical protein
MMKKTHVSFPVLNLTRDGIRQGMVMLVLISELRVNGSKKLSNPNQKEIGLSRAKGGMKPIPTLFYKGFGVSFHCVISEYTSGYVSMANVKQL